MKFAFLMFFSLIMYLWSLQVLIIDTLVAQISVQIGLGMKSYTFFFSYFPVEDCCEGRLETIF